MEFREGTPVHTAKGQLVGMIERFVIDPDTRQVIGLVVRRGFLLTFDRVVPVEAVASAEEDLVILRPDVGSPDDFPRFEETQPVAPLETEHYHDHNPTLEGTRQWAVPFNPPAPDRQRRVRNIPADTVPLQEGARVITRDGQHVGDVIKVFTDDGDLQHFVVSKGLLTTEEKVVPGDWVADLREDKVVLTVDAEMIDQLAAFIRDEE